MTIQPKLRKIVRNSVLAFALTTLLQSRPDVLAQPNPDAPHRRPPQAGADRRDLRPQPGFQPGRAVPLLEEVLTDEQRDSLHAAMESQREKQRGLQEKLRAARQALMKASLAEKFDEEAVRTKAMEVGKLEAELSVLRAKAFSKVQPPLSEEQIEKISNPPPREMPGPPGGPAPGTDPRRNHRPPPGPRDLPVQPKPESP